MSLLYALQFLSGTFSLTLHSTSAELAKNILTCIYEPSAIWAGSERTASYDAEFFITTVVEANASNFRPWLTFIPPSATETAGYLPAATGFIHSVASKVLVDEPATVIPDCTATAAATTVGASTAAASTTAATSTANTAATTTTITATTAFQSAAAAAAAEFPKDACTSRPEIS